MARHKVKQPTRDDLAHIIVAHEARSRIIEDRRVGGPFTAPMLNDLFNKDHNADVRNPPDQSARIKRICDKLVADGELKKIPGGCGGNWIAFEPAGSMLEQVKAKVYSHHDALHESIEERASGLGRDGGPMDLEVHDTMRSGARYYSISGRDLDVLLSLALDDWNR